MFNVSPCGAPPSTPPRSTKRPKKTASPRTPRSKKSRTPVLSPPKTPTDDRFIPNRGSMDFDEANHALTRVETPKSDGRGNARPVEVEFRRAMRTALMPRSTPSSRGGALDSAGEARGESANSKIFRFSGGGSSGTTSSHVGQERDSFERFRSALEVIADPSLSSDGSAASRSASLARPVPTKPSRILDAPDIVDDYYLNLLSWSSTNVLAVALANNVYLWNAATNEVSELLQLDQGDCVTSVAWAPGGAHLLVGTDSAAVQLYDTTRMVMVRSMRGHTARVGSLAWNPVSRCVNSGSRDSTILQHDARAARHRLATLVGHQQEVCGLSWSADGSTLASGGNENFLCLWDAARSGASAGAGRGSSSNGQARAVSSSNLGLECAPRAVLRQHQAAVKALSWCPMHRNLLASGGGTADRTIKFWNAHTGAMLHSVDTGSQVCALLWSRHHKEIVSSHGFSQNQLCLWRYPSMTKLCELTGHTARVLHLAQSPDGETVVSAAADETLRFWSIFGQSPANANGAQGQRKGAHGAIRTLGLSSGLSSVGDGLSIR